MAPRLSASPRKSKSQSTSGAIRSEPASIGDNSSRDEESERVQLISFVAQLTQAEVEVEQAKGPYDAAKKKRSSIVNLAKAAGYTGKELKARMEEMNREPGENEHTFAREGRHRRWLGITSPEQQRMHLEPGLTPREHMDEHDWNARGYRDGLRGLPATLPEGIPPRMDQPYLKGHETGRGEYVKTLEANAPKPIGAAAKVRQQAAEDFRQDNPEAASLADERLAEKREERAVRQALDNLSGEDPEAPFEASEEELAAQKPRQAVHDARDAEEVV